MRGQVFVDTEVDYLAWLSEQTTFAALAQPTRLGAVEPVQ
jgi:heme/copper-type cytochrome/quinol oxidase subunit 2